MSRLNSWMNFHLSILHTCLLGNWISQQVNIHTVDHHTKPSSHLPPPSPYSAFHSFVCILVCIFELHVCLKLLIQGERGCCEWALHHINMWVLPCRKPLSPLERSQPSAARPTSLKNTITGVNTNRKLCCYLSWSAWSLCFFSRLSARITFSFSPSLPPSFPPYALHIFLQWQAIILPVAPRRSRWPHTSDRHLLAQTNGCCGFWWHQSKTEQVCRAVGIGASLTQTRQHTQIPRGRRVHAWMNIH